MNKVYAICKDIGDQRLELDVIGWVTSEDEAKAKCKELNEPYEQEKKIRDQCYECRRYEEEDYHQENEMFRLKDTCERASIHKDRHGDYCKNDETAQYYGYVSDWYMYREINKL